MSYQIWVGYFVYQKSLKRTFKTGFWVQNHLMNLCSSAVDSQWLLCSQKSWCEMFVLKLSGIQRLFPCLVRTVQTKIKYKNSTNILLNAWSISFTGILQFCTWNSKMHYYNIIATIKMRNKFCYPFKNGNFSNIATAIVVALLRFKGVSEK